MAEPIEISLGGKAYIWTGSDWYSKSTYLQPPKTVQRELNRLLEKHLEAEELQLTNIGEILNRASKAREAGQFSRAIRLARQALVIVPDSHAAAAVLCASLRASGYPEKALKDTERFLPTHFPALLTSRAAALCDLQKWKEAKIEVGRSLAIQKSQEAFNVVSRIKKYAPDLY